ncbi:hypothetical protein BDV26DRAFT_271307, partial [Aspergillus bertholletiae]
MLREGDFPAWVAAFMLLILFRMRRSDDVSPFPRYLFFPLWSSGFHFFWSVMVDMHLVGRIVSGNVRDLFLDRPMYAIFVSALARKGSVFGGSCSFSLLWLDVLHL